MSEVALRFGSMAAVYYEILDEKVPKQMDLLDRWFPGLIIKTETSDDKTKIAAEYVDREYRIHAVKYHGKFYSGESKRVSQIFGRLTGTAAGNREKERKSAELIQKHVAEQFIQDMELTPRLVTNVMERFDRFSDEQADAIGQKIFELIFALAQQREALDDYDRKMEAFSMDDEVFDGVLYNAAYQLNLDSYEGLCQAYLWLLTGGLLRNETGRVLRVYDSSFIATRRQISETGTEGLRQILKRKMGGVRPDLFIGKFRAVERVQALKKSALQGLANEKVGRRCKESRPLYSVSEICAQAQITRKTLFYYDKIGLLTPSERSDTQKVKFYDENKLARLDQILMYREAGLSIANIREILDNDCADRAGILNRTMDRLVKTQMNVEREIWNLKCLPDFGKNRLDRSLGNDGIVNFGS